MIYSQFANIAKVGDFVALGGMGIVDGLRNICKRSCYKVIAVTDDRTVFLRGHGKKSSCVVSHYFHSQECAVLSKSEYKALPLTMFGY